MAAATEVPKTHVKYKLEIKAENASAPTKFPVDVLYDKLVSIELSTENQSNGEAPTASAAPENHSAPIRDAVRFELDSKLNGEITLSDVVYPSKLEIDIIGSDGAARVTRTIEIKAPENASSEGSSSVQLEQAEIDAILRVPEAPKELPGTISRAAIFVEILLGQTTPKNQKAEFTRASLQVAPVKFDNHEKKWESSGFAKLFSHGASPITTSVVLTKPLPIGIASLPWTSTHIAVDGRFTAHFLNSANGYNAWAWLLIGAKPMPMLGVISNQDLSSPSSLVLSIILPSAALGGESKGNNGQNSGNGSGESTTNLGNAVGGSSSNSGCSCDDKSRLKTPAIVSETELVNNPGVYTEDPGAFCKPFSNPERILSERSFYSVVRVEQPVISAEATTAIRSPPSQTFSRRNFRPVAAIDRPAVSAAAAFRKEVILNPIFLNRGRREMSASHPVQWEGESLRYQATTVCRGHILEFRNRTRSNGYSLGGVAKTLTLAPRQTKRIQKIEWSRTERNSRTERQRLEDNTNDSTNKETSYQDSVAATLDEWSQGSSKSGVTSAAAGGGMALGPVVIGGGVASSSSHSESQQSGGRDTTASEESQWRDAVRRHGDALRKFESTVVQEVSQNESVTGTVEVVRNVNYAHSLTVVYHNILRHLRVDVKFAGVRECLFVPFAMQRFTISRAYQWRETIGKYLRDRKHARALSYAKDIETNWATSSVPAGRRCDHPIKYLVGSVFIELGIARPENSAEGKLDLVKWAMLHPFLPSPAVNIFASLAVYVADAQEAVFQQKYAPTIAQKWCNVLQLLDTSGPLAVDFTMATAYRFSNVVRIDFQVDTTRNPTAITRQTLANITLKSVNALPPGSMANVRTVAFSFETDFESGKFTQNQGVNDLIMPGDGSVDTMGANMTKPPNAYEQQDLRAEISAAMDDCIDHLNENMEYYHKAIWWNMDRDRLFMMLDGFYVPRAEKQVSLASVVEREPLAVVGNSLVYRVAAGAFVGSPDMGIDSPEKLFNWYNPPKTVSEPMHISLPTDGLYARTIMDECNAVEEHYGSTDWALNDPDPELGFLDPALLASRKSDPGNQGPTTLPGTIINLQNAQPAPTPQGVANTLQAVQNANAFRDMAGLAATQSLAKAGLDTAASLATSFGGAATSVRLAEIASKQQATADADRKLASVQRAKDKGLVSQEEGEKQAAQILQGMSGTQSVPAPHENETIQEAIKVAKNTPGSTLEATTPAGHVMLGFAMTNQLLGGVGAMNSVADVPDPLPRGERPTFAALKAAHLAFGIHNTTVVRQTIGGAASAAWLGANTCTIRMSHGLNFAGVPIPFKGKFRKTRIFRFIDDKINYMLTEKGKDPPGLNYAYRSRELIDWLRGEWGEPNYQYPQGPHRSPGAYYDRKTSPFWGKKGVIAFALPEVAPSASNSSPASGHIDVWDGEKDTRGGDDLWSDFVHIYLWVLD